MSRRNYQPVIDAAPETAQFRTEVLRGLRRRFKTLPCKYFYDETGSHLFDRICELDEYYVTRTELAIMRRHAGAMAEAVGPNAILIEYGSGSSTKTRLLLDALTRGVHATPLAAYVPVDIAREHLLAAARAIADAYPDLDVLPVCADFTAPFDLPPVKKPAARRVIYFPGSTIGNFGPTAAANLLGGMAAECGPGGGVLIGVDLQKDPHLLHAAYDDVAGVTRDFNLNLLARINRELGGDFRRDRFRHHAFYQPRHGRVEMHLISLADQTVHVGPARFRFREGESVRTECSYKYTLGGFRDLARRVGLDVRRVWTDERRLFSVQYLTPAGQP
jgi:dimethylhistidine N-methyltransferase